MPHYYFHLHNRDGVTPDEEGQELDGLGEAHSAALAGIRSLLAGEVEEGMMDLDGRLEVTEGGVEPVLVVSFREAVAVRAPGSANG
jgi:hypothetical protein